MKELKEVKELNEEINNIKKEIDIMTLLLEKLERKRDSIEDPHLIFLKKEREYLQGKLGKKVIIDIKRNGGIMMLYFSAKDDYYFYASITTEIISEIPVFKLYTSTRTDSHIETVKSLYNYSLEICDRYKEFLKEV